MLSLKELLPFYPENLWPFREFILREYLQHKILEAIFDEPELANKICFIGGTCLRVVHGNNRFSEDIDFDNFNLTPSQFEHVAEVIEKKLTRQGYQVEMKTVMKGAYHCNIRFPGLLFQEGLSGHHEQKILVQVDTEPQHYEFTPHRHILNKFDVFTEITVAPLSLLLAQKFYSILNRKRSMGRDFYDCIFLLAKQVKPDLQYLKQKTNFATTEDIRSAVLKKCSTLDMKALAKDVAPFLFNPVDEKKVRMFEQYIQTAEM